MVTKFPADAKVIEGSLEVNESLLTGEEMDSISKEPDAELFSGSFVTAGEAFCQVIHVGAKKIILKKSIRKRKRSSGKNT